MNPSPTPSSDLLKSVTAKVAKVIPDLGIHNFSESFGMYQICTNCRVKMTDHSKRTQCGLPRPITLEDVLRASYDKNRPDVVLNLSDGTLWIDEEVPWILGSPLSSQSEDTLRFLDEILPPLR